MIAFSVFQGVKRKKNKQRENGKRRETRGSAATDGESVGTFRRGAG
jgi:hypothetical protein